ncbi:WD repeat-containing protein 91 homolog [Carassius carassius]|uniref:WD repeat-containing protein 91 homolog n=1 Tax=Carassius carassius TaxID=217509 RepID=UPI0028695C74|nr:WD repeat-containing protein 91 homolog [Carassius carassius]
MEWRIIVPVLCLIGFLSVPGYAAETNITVTPNNGTTNSTINGTINGTTNTTTNSSTNTTTNSSTNTTTNSSTNTTTNSPTNNSPTTFEFNITFHIDDTFNANYADMTNNDTIALKNKIISQVTPAYTQFKNFQRFDILQFRNGSIVVDGKLIFNNSDSKPSVANLTQILNNGNFTFKVLSNLTNIAEVTTTAGQFVFTDLSFNR